MRRPLRPAAVALALGVWATAATAQPPAPPPTEITLRPAGEPVPALKYRLLPDRRALVPGNAAVFYHRALEFSADIRGRRLIQRSTANKPPVKSVEEQVASWVSGPIGQIPREEARQQLAHFENALKEVELGATRSYCDWEFDLRKEGFSLLLPEIQEMRTIARLVALKARLAVLDGKTDDAVHWVQTGLAMGRHVGHGPIIIQGLVGVAIDSVMLKCLEDLIQAPGTPSLFWALADRPRPFLDMRYPMEGERVMLERELPGLANLDRGVWSVDEAKRFTDDVERKLLPYFVNESYPGFSPLTFVATSRRLGFAVIATKIYPEARRALIARGRPEAEVDAMPVVQVAALYSIQEYRRLSDDAYKWLNLPYWQSHGRADRVFSHSQREKMANPLLTMFQMLAPALEAARLAGHRLERQFDAIQCVEAVRLYAAAHEGKLPASLDDLTDAPVPIDVLTGKPFGYKVEGDTATLIAPVPPGEPNHHTYMIRYVLKRSAP
jgi:hypothetical protein